jgi:hydroxyethylthiazole kinase
MIRDSNLNALLTKIKREKPLVHNITNYVVMNFTANSLLAMGASPVMAHAVEEVEEMVSIASALVINIGTLSSHWIEAMIKAGKMANQKNVPIVLDPVGAGATTLRTDTFKRLVADLEIAIVRGNPSEVLSIKSRAVTTKGVDSAHAVDQAVETAQTLAREIGAVVAITGPVDLITNGRDLVRCGNGHALLGSVTGTGCAATATIGAFAGVTKDPLEAAAAGLAFFGLAGEVAAGRSSAPGSFMIALLDALHEITPEELQLKARLESA